MSDRPDRMTAASPAGTLTSPDGRLMVEVDVLDRSLRQRRCLHLAARYDGQTMLEPSPLGLALGGPPPLSTHLIVEHVETTSADTTWTPVCGERNRIHDRFHQLRIELREAIPPRRRLIVVVRAYDEGLAFRYELPLVERAERFTIVEELTTFVLPGGCRGYDTKRAQSTYELRAIGEIGEDCERPLTLVYPHGKVAALGEAGNLDCARMKLRTRRETPQVVLGLQASLAGEVVDETPWASPWRYLLVGDRPGDLIERNHLLLNLSPESRVADTSWIRPGKVIREVTLSTAGGKACVDFAVAHNLQHIEYDAGWYGHEYFDQSDATRVDPDPDRTRKVEGWSGLGLPEVIQYAKDRGIGVWLYVNRRALERQLHEIVPLFASWGVAGIKFGFVEVGPQSWTKWLHEAVELCARHRLMVDIHDEYRVTGITRTWPNLLTVEGILGNEGFPSATHNVTLPFTRFVCGPADYTICIYEKRLKTRRTHQLAMSVVYFSPLQFLFWYDRPSAYQGEPEIRFLADVPTTWDDTRVLAGEIGEYVAVARRKGENWFLGAMTNEQPRTLRLPLDRLGLQGRYRAEVYRDPSVAAPQNDVRIDQFEIGASTTLDVVMAGSGGYAARLSPL